MRTATAILLAGLMVVPALAGCLDTSPGPGDDGDRKEPPARLETPRLQQIAEQAGIELCPDPASSGNGSATHVPGAGWGDYDADGDPDLYVACHGPNLLLENTGNGTFTDVTDEAGVAGSANSWGIAWGDFDDDGCPDLYVANHGSSANLSAEGASNVLYRNACDGTFTDATDRTGASHPTDHSASAAWVDFDNDGDLDLYVANRGVVDPSGTTRLRTERNRLYENRNGTFVDVAETAGVAGAAVGPGEAPGEGEPTGASFGVVWLYYNFDPYIDLFVTNGPGPDRLYRNDGNGTFTDVTDEAGLSTSGHGRGVDAGDLDNDGDTDLFVANRGEDRLWRNEWQDPDRRGEFTEVASTLGVQGDGESWGAGFEDLNDDGRLDLFVVGAATGNATGERLYVNQRNGTFRDVTGEAGLGTAATSAAAAFADHEGDGDVDVYVTRPEDADALWQNGGTSDHWIGLHLVGNFSTRDGVGAQVKLVNENVTQHRTVRAGSGGLASSDKTVHFGLGRFDRVDLVEILWPSGVRQVITNVTEVNDTFTLHEEMTVKTSCPLVFACDDRCDFVSDTMGTSYTGWQFAPGRQWRPDPTYRLKIDDFEPTGGSYEIRLAEALEETDYIDMARLTVVDHPEDVNVIPDERFKIFDPRTDFGLVTLDDARPVASARTDTGRDVTDLVTEHDGRSPDVPARPPPKFDGYAENHTITLDLGDLSGAEQVRLAAWGWIYYPVVASQLAAEGSYLSLIPPKLEAKDPATGEWVPVTDDLGFPAGLPKWWTADLTGKLPDGAHEIRITTNLQIHWDQILVDTTRPTSDVQVHELAPSSADLHRLGYPTYEYTGQQNPGRYTYDRISRYHVWDTPEGNYTRYGDVTPLLEETDDKFVIFPHGDELTVKFDAGKLPPVPDGWERSVFLDLDGFFKDMIETNAHPDTVEPLPFHNMSNYPYDPSESYPDDPEHRAYRQKWNTRYIEGGTISMPERTV